MNKQKLQDLKIQLEVAIAMIEELPLTKDLVFAKQYIRLALTYIESEIESKEGVTHE